MKNLVISLFLSLALLLVGAVSLTHAQNTGDQMYNNNPQGTGGISSQGQGTDTTSAAGPGFDFRWLLPLLAIPVLFLFVRDSNEDDRYYDQPYAGVKGGKSNKKKEE
jgi:hypothetical protein